MSLRALYSGIKRVLTKPNYAHLRHAPYVTSITPPSELPPWSPVTLLQKDLEEKCGYPLYSSIKRMASFKPQSSSGILSAGFDAERDEPLGTESHWAMVAAAADFHETISRLEAAGINASRMPLEVLSSSQRLKSSLAENIESLQPPTWLVMHILCNQVQTYDDMLSALKLLYYHIPAAPSNIRSTLLIVTAIRLAQLRMTAPFRRLVSCFLQFSDTYTADDFNLVIRAIALLPGSREVSALSIGLVRLAAARNFHLTERTFDALLEPARGTRLLARTLQDVARSQRYTFTRHQLERLLQLMTRLRYTKMATYYRNRLRSTQASPNVKPIPTPQLQSTDDTPAKGSTTSTIATPKRGAKGAVRRIVRWTQRVAIKRKGHSRKKVPRFSNVNTVVFPVDDWASALLVAARSRAVSRQEFIQLWRRGPALYYEQLTTYHYNITIQGLLDRWAIPQARELWTEFRRRRLPLNKHSIGLGTAVLAYHREPLRAFYFLEKISKVQQRRATIDDLDRSELSSTGRAELVTVGTSQDSLNSLADHDSPQYQEDEPAHHVAMGDLDPDDTVISLSTVFHDEAEDTEENTDVDKLAGSKSAVIPTRIPHDPHRHRRPQVAVNMHAVNRFMNALHCMGRPSAVFALWDYMGVLWGLRPDVYSLNIVLQTARWSIKYNSTLHGAMARWTRFREPDDPGVTPGWNPRVHARRRMILLTNGKKNFRPHSLWNGEPAARRALGLAVRVLLSNWPHLRKVHSPLPMRASSILERVLGSHREKLPKSQVSPLVALAEEWLVDETYLQIVPTDVTFRAILDLLDANDLTTEVPLVMAWMRKLQIPPSGNTFATALMYWRAVPDPERWGDRQESYKALYSYLYGWRRDRMPRKRAWGHTFRRLNIFSRFTRWGLTKTRIHTANVALRSEPQSRSDVVVRPLPPHMHQNWLASEQEG